MTTACIGMGGNLASWAGSPEATLAAAARRLSSLGRVTCRSSLYSTKPVGFTAQPQFVNAIVALETELGPRELLNGLLGIEQEFGRDRTAGIANGPRTLDLDLLLFGDQKICEPGLEVPHPRMAERNFVLVPLREIAPLMGDAANPGSVKQLLQSMEAHGEGDKDAVVAIDSDAWGSGACGPRV